ncbi:Interactor of constitutive active ROPs 4 [Platanthera zijinensis]|uniref:Interactor of constitutive active ROPs 4 n=1 Tax=Platanthera zijinensis TaxID=2320716 RepID=A0AAP0B9L9_9ASPA
MVELKLLKEQLELEEVATRVVLKKLENTKKKKEEEEKLLPVEKDSDSCITTDICEVAACCTEENESLMMEMAEMRAKLAEKEKELETVKEEAEQATASSSAERNRNNEIETKLAQTEEKLRQSREMLEQMKQRVESQEVEKDAMEAEMKRLSIQTDQWRKASEAAASILNHESFRSAGKPIDTCGEGRGGRGGGGIRVLGELWKKRGQHK